MSTALYVLGTLARHGPMHGHKIRRTAEIERAEQWGEVKVGALYGTLRRLSEDGLIEPVRTERMGKFPARTVYAITEEGRRELRVLRAAILRRADLRPDPVDIALVFSDDISEDQLSDVIKDRITALERGLEALHHLYKVAEPYISLMERATFRHFELRFDAELRWHRDLAAGLPAIVDERHAQVGNCSTDSQKTSKGVPG